MSETNFLAEAAKKHQLNKNQIIALLGEDRHEKELFAAADAVRKEFVGDEVHLRGLIEFSNICKNNCLYCGLRRDNRNLKRYRMSPEEIVALATRAVREYGFKTIVMQSGEDLWFTPERLKPILTEIKKLDVAVTLSIGERSYEDYKAFREAGADRYLMRIETTDKDLYHKLDPQMSWQKRYECLLMIKELGYELGSGIMVGLPEQTLESIADDLLFLQDLRVDMAGIGPFIPHPDTPLKDEDGRAFRLSLRTMSIMRLLLPDINIPATTAMETLHPDGRIIALQCGANVIMPNVTEGEYRQLYKLYPGKAGLNETPLHSKTSIGARIEAIGRTIGTGYGSHRKQNPA